MRGEWHWYDVPSIILKLAVIYGVLRLAGDPATAEVFWTVVWGVVLTGLIAFAVFANW
jgi:hypothetical protein